MFKKTLQLFALTLLAAAATVRAESGFGRFHALVIGNQNYTKLKLLETPIADAKAVAEVLEKQYGFTVELLLDATDKEILTAISKLRKTMTKKEDNLLIYYAGHGYLDKQSGVDYWQPINAAKDDDVDWVPTSRITDLLKVIQARHVLIVADSCYSGSLLTRDSGAKLASGLEHDEWLRRVYQKRSRTALTSGGKEPVIDGGGGGHSVFAKAFLDALRENQKILDGDGLFEKIKRPIALNAEQTPLYGDIRMTGHEMGDFLLVPKELHGTELQSVSHASADLRFLQRNGEEAGSNNAPAPNSKAPNSKNADRAARPNQDMRVPMTTIMQDTATKQVEKTGLSGQISPPDWGGYLSVAGVGGGMLGYIIKNEMDEFDYKQLHWAYEKAPSGKPLEWMNPDSNNQYQVILQRSYSNGPSNQNCRKAEIVAVIDGKTQQIFITACRDADNNWQIQP